MPLEVELMQIFKDTTNPTCGKYGLSFQQFLDKNYTKSYIEKNFPILHSHFSPSSKTTQNTDEIPDFLKTLFGFGK